MAPKKAPLKGAAKASVENFMILKRVKYVLVQDYLLITQNTILGLLVV